ncbi:MAG: twitching motility protein PilT [Litorilinea sp.]|nr:MAG: twitching motility protein PilT [Litorilinea sp.]
MEVVVDASVIIAVIANEPQKQRLITLTTGADLIAPFSIHWEIGNAFSAMLKKGRITLHQAIRAIAIYQNIPIRFAEIELEKSLKIAAELNIYAYDAYLICCALKYNAPLLSLDQNLVRLAQMQGVNVIEVEP